MDNKIQKLNFLLEELNNITVIPSSIDINYYTKLFNDTNTNEEKIAICEKFIMSIKLNDKRPS